MKTSRLALLPKQTRLLELLGANIRLARLRRNFPASLVAARAGISRPTLRAIENGAPQVSLGAYTAVLFSLGLDQDLKRVAVDDELGRKLQDAQLETKKRAVGQRRSKDKGV